jgi:hypothetical protein
VDGQGHGSKIQRESMRTREREMCG